MTSRFQPARGTRGTNGYVYFELSLAQGPVAIGVTGNNRVEDFIGYAWLLLMAEDRTLHLFKQRATVGEWDEVTDDLPTVAFGAPLPEGARRVTFCFDQSARIIIAYEYQEQIYVTRWDAPTQQYVQNVTFAGVDPCLFFDATVMNPLGYPSAATDGWSIREAYYAGIPIEYEWLAEAPPTYRDNPINDSDVVLFYLTPDRTGVRARVQRQLYLTVNTIYDFAEPIVMDRAVALYAKYELLISNAAGDKLANMLISDPYVGDWIIYYRPEEIITASLSFASWVTSQLLGYYTADEPPMTAALALNDWAHIAQLGYYPVAENPLVAALSAFPDWSHVALLGYHLREEPAMVASVPSLPDWSHVRMNAYHQREDTFGASLSSFPNWRHQEV